MWVAPTSTALPEILAGDEILVKHGFGYSSYMDTSKRS